MLNFSKQFKQLITTHYSDPYFNYEQLCDLLQLNRSQVYRNCQKFGLGPPAAYIRQYRIRAARKLIRETDLQITEICYEVGYSSLAHFSNNFTSAYQLTPTEYRAISNKQKK